MNVSLAPAMQLNIWQETFFVLLGLLLLIGYFQYRRSRDIIEVIQEVARPARLISALIGAVAYFILRLIMMALSWLFS